MAPKRPRIYVDPHGRGERPNYKQLRRAPVRRRLIALLIPPPGATNLFACRFARDRSPAYSTQGRDCGLAFGGIVFCNTSFIRDCCGGRTKEICPFFSPDLIAVASLRRAEPVEGSTIPPSVLAGSPLAFRGDARCPESVARTYNMRLRTYGNPRVSVAYTPHNRLYCGKLKHLSLTRPWRVVWEDWIAHRVFWQVSDRGSRVRRVLLSAMEW
ncbi:hypothetical protein DFH06DRAFT_1352720 [Mycena polygramma]|nr:hypothetical protein DFH06DRAFT_1352720 [Mycena polygramma]